MSREGEGHGSNASGVTVYLDISPHPPACWRHDLPNRSLMPPIIPSSGPNSSLRFASCLAGGVWRHRQKSVSHLPGHSDNSIPIEMRNTRTAKHELHDTVFLLPYPPRLLAGFVPVKKLLPKSTPHMRYSSESGAVSFWQTYAPFLRVATAVILPDIQHGRSWKDTCMILPEAV